MSDLELKSIGDARRMLAQAESVATVKSLADKASVVSSYAKKLHLPDWLAWAEYKVDALRRAGQMLAQLAPGQGARTDLLTSPESGEVRAYAATLESARIAPQRASEWTKRQVHLATRHQRHKELSP